MRAGFVTERQTRADKLLQKKKNSANIVVFSPSPLYLQLLLHHLVGLGIPNERTKHATSDAGSTLERNLGHKHPHSQGSVALYQKHPPHNDKNVIIFILEVKNSFKPDENKNSKLTHTHLICYLEEPLSFQEGFCTCCGSLGAFPTLRRPRRGAPVFHVSVPPPPPIDPHRRTAPSHRCSLRPQLQGAAPVSHCLQHLCVLFLP